MRPIVRFASIAAASLLPLVAQAATISGEDYATQYDYREFYSAVDNKNFLVVLKGVPLPGLTPEEGAQRLLPILQAAKPPPRLTFTYAEATEPQRPDYRMFLVFDPANDLSADSVCGGAERHKTGGSGRFYVFAVYCRNGSALAQVTGWTKAQSPDDPDMLDLYKGLLRTLFSASELLRQDHKPTFR